MVHTNVKCKCKDCIHCDIENHKCYPQSKDCHSEYDLTDDDIYNNLDRCDFYEARLLH